MKYLFIQLFLLFSLFANAYKPLKIGIITDTHYLSEKLMDGGSAIKKFSKATARDAVDEPAILDQVIADYLKSDIQVLLVAGDITKDGEKQSHLDFVKKLKPLMDKGVRVYVIPGNHDINMPSSLKYVGDKTFPVENVSPQEFTQIYANCGYNSALKRDAASLSYLASLDDNTWLICIDDCLYKQYTVSSISAGQINPETEKWIVSILDEAKRKHKTVIGMMHHGLVEHIIYQAQFFPEYLTANREHFATLFANGGMKAIFTGHFHANDITEYSTLFGNKIYDIETGALISYPFAYRFVSLTPDGMDIHTRNITATPLNPNLVEESKENLKKVVHALAERKINGIGFIPPETAKILIKMVTHIFLLHLKGDEKVDAELKGYMKEFNPEWSVSDASDLQLDYPPADNNVKILFSK